MKSLNIPSLEIFVAAVEEKSLSRAAEQLNLVTSAASKRITELERHLGKALLQRHGRGVEPTPAGDLLYLRAKAILRSVQLAESAVAGFSADGLAKIRLAASPSAILQFLPGPMGRFLSAQNKLRIDLIEAHSYDIPRLVGGGDADIGLYHASQAAPGVSSVRFGADRVGLVVPIGHPLSQRRSLRLEEALDFDFLGYFPQHSLEKFLAYVGAAISRPPNVKLQVSNFETRCRMIREGLGIGIVPERIAANYLGAMGLTLLHLEDDWARREFYLCLRDGGEPGSPVARLADFLLQPEG